MPKLSDSMADAVIVRWLKSPGDPFERGEGLIEVETDKATVVYEAESDGTLGSILVPEGATVAVGEPIATVANGERGSSRHRQCTRRSRRRSESRRRSRSGQPSISASRSTASSARGPAAGSPLRTCRRPRPSRRDRGTGARDGGKGAVRSSRADADAVHDRPPDGRVGDHDSGLHRLDRHRRVPDRSVAARGTEIGRGRSLAQRLRREGGGHSASRVSAIQRLVRRRQGRVLLPRQRRRRGCRRRGAARARRTRRRPEVARADRRGHEAARGCGTSVERWSPTTSTTAPSRSRISACSVSARSPRSSTRRRSRSSRSGVLGAHRSKTGRTASVP